ncbi:putative Late nodulin [Medicago truncatula]|uniref:Nodule Cysteine-Rich (NCR) secreted peptide n=1 Tax=Medicago truncatula TaxID=3880 RepID=A0A072UTT4_MEDTR|nr:Nodule Cysteine-Rich (NCR) secreted peptide [Medicago truncatula]RHN65730.1 putative Late nodulin [Medicago truncatula]
MTHKLVYAIILFIFLFLVANNVEGYILCKTVNDCPPNTRNLRYRCIDGKCKSHRVLYEWDESHTQDITITPCIEE